MILMGVFTKLKIVWLGFPLYSRMRFGRYLVPNPPPPRLHLKFLYLFPYFRTKRPALFVIYRDKNISTERRFNELSIDV